MPSIIRFKQFLMVDIPNKLNITISDFYWVCVLRFEQKQTTTLTLIKH